MSAFGGKADIVLASQDSAATDYDSTAFHMGTAVKCFCPHLGGLVIVTLVTHRIAIASVHLRHARQLLVGDRHCEPLAGTQAY
jgi:hypothetical protein